VVNEIPVIILLSVHCPDWKSTTALLEIYEMMQISLTYPRYGRRQAMFEYIVDRSFLASRWAFTFARTATN
jgi:hypothetical protein